MVADHILAARGSGEFALRHILMPMAHGRAPLEDALQHIQARSDIMFSSRPSNPDCEATLQERAATCVDI